MAKKKTPPKKKVDPNPHGIGPPVLTDSTWNAWKKKRRRQEARDERDQSEEDAEP